MKVGLQLFAFGLNTKGLALARRVDDGAAHATVVPSAALAISRHRARQSREREARVAVELEQRRTTSIDCEVDFVLIFFVDCCEEERGEAEGR